MRLKKTLNRSVTGADGKVTKYYKWTIADVPRDLVEALGWKETDELVGEVRNGALHIRAQ